ncbi:sulfatase family protein [Pedobacter insulae]|uniref:Arylsulfatase A n=1 Tax=Pedobacter insulae TaxID=414048 RepID=A0A1I2TRL2_9SPHI|nr:sulfatase [Pedobacter insulae]SFG66819.1 Arylsulfatase A [Pedobacter insulae]
MKKVLFLLLSILGSNAFSQSNQVGKPMNIVFILSDDHRFDFMGFTGKVPGLETPAMDFMAKNGAYLKNAFVTTSLCSPSRASILTGQYAHTHTIVDNNAPMPKDLKFFPQYLQKKGYQTAFMGKWHMGNTDDQPQPGFNKWISFKGQGEYYNPTFNIDGKEIKQPRGSYTTDLLTDYALDFIKQSDKNKPFFVYLSHKGVHADFQPAKRHAGKYKDMEVISPPSMYLTATDSSKKYGKILEPKTRTNKADIPLWVKNQRYSWHGVDYMYDGTINFIDFYRRYNETLLSIDESIAKVLAELKKEGLDKNTLVIYMGDNGFQFGEHGLIDKRDMYEASLRVPMLAYAPGMIKPGLVVNEMIENIDIAPTFLALAGIKKPTQIQGLSFANLLKGSETKWRDKIFYEYYWEWAFPQTPTMFGVRTEQFKYIFNQGVWDANELYDLKNDPEEINNLIRDPRYSKIAGQLKKDMWDWLEQTGGMQIPLKRVDSKRIDHLYKGTY